MLVEESLKAVESIGTLNYENQEKWFKRMKDFFALSNLWPCIDEQSDDTQIRTDMHLKALACLKRFVDLKLREKLDTYENAKDAWIFLNNYYQTRLNSEDIKIVGKISNFKIDNEDRLAPNFDSFNYLFRSLNKIETVEEFKLALFCSKMNLKEDDELLSQLTTAPTENRFRLSLLKTKKNNNEQREFNRSMDCQSERSFRQSSSRLSIAQSNHNRNSNNQNQNNSNRNQNQDQGNRNQNQNQNNSNRNQNQNQGNRNQNQHQNQNQSNRNQNQNQGNRNQHQNQNQSNRNQNQNQGNRNQNQNQNLNYSDRNQNQNQGNRNQFQNQNQSNRNQNQNQGNRNQHQNQNQYNRNQMQDNLQNNSQRNNNQYSSSQSINNRNNSQHEQIDYDSRYKNTTDDRSGYIHNNKRTDNHGDQYTSSELKSRKSLPEKSRNVTSSFNAFIANEWNSDIMAFDESNDLNGNNKSQCESVTKNCPIVGTSQRNRERRSSDWTSDDCDDSHQCHSSDYHFSDSDLEDDCQEVSINSKCASNSNKNSNYNSRDRTNVNQNADEKVDRNQNAVAANNDTNDRRTDKKKQSDSNINKIEKFDYDDRYGYTNEDVEIFDY